MSGSDFDARTLAAALGGRWRNSRGVARCPAHADRSPSLSIRDGDHGHPIVHCFAGCDFRDVRAALMRMGLWPDRGRKASEAELVEMARHRRERLRRERQERLERELGAAALFHGAQPLEPLDLADRYLSGRCLPPRYPQTLRLGVHVSASSRRWPALLAGATRWPGRHVVAVQATPLKEPGVKAWRMPSRVTLGCVDGAAVRLAPWEAGRAIVLVEGVEDGLAVLAAMPDAVPWAALGAANAAAALLPPGADVILTLDGDDAGRKAAQAAVPALWRRGHRVRVAHLPDGADPLDLIKEASS